MDPITSCRPHQLGNLDLVCLISWTWSLMKSLFHWIWYSCIKSFLTHRRNKLGLCMIEPWPGNLLLILQGTLVWISPPTQPTYEVKHYLFHLFFHLIPHIPHILRSSFIFYLDHILVVISDYFISCMSCVFDVFIIYLWNKCVCLI